MAKKWTIGLLGGVATLCLGFGFGVSSTKAMAEGFVIPEMVTGTATEAVVGEVSIPSFQIKNSASIRVKAPNGIRFETSISSTDLAKLPANATFGTLIIPTAVLDGATLDLAAVNTLAAANVEATVWRSTSTESALTYSGVLVGTSAMDFPEEFYGEEITARGYVSYTDSNNETQVIYTTDTAERSLAYVAGAALKGNFASQEGDEGYLAPENVTFLTGIVDKVVSEIGITVGGEAVSTYEMNVNDSVTFEVTGNQGVPAIITTTGGISVDGNTVTATSEGAATLTAQVGNRTSTITFNVSNDEPYVVPFATFESNTGAPYLTDAGEGKVGLVTVNWEGRKVVYITGENWANLKAFAAEKGYTKLVLTIHEVAAGMNIISTLGSTVGSHTWNLADFAAEETLTVMDAWNAADGYSLVLFTLTLEK